MPISDRRRADLSTSGGPTSETEVGTIAFCPVDATSARRRQELSCARYICHISWSYLQPITCVSAIISMGCTINYIYVDDSDRK